ncbi:MAG TPA: serine/threonine-protein kinase [Terriglobales bacterium]|jgi:serine/threonine protein kinase|nr:serine/threonine-protein kinase [Terriglobales bacterium]
MANKIGRFEILSEITRSEIGAVYKAADPDSGQTIALKAIQLQMLGDQASVLIDHILQEAEGTKPLSSHNIAVLYGLEEIEGQFCAAMEYVQGNSIGTMLARKEGFSIWDLQDIARQTCQGLDHAHSHHVVHYSLEPAKIMVTWDGTVKILSFGASSMGAFTCQASGKAPEVLHYVSPEQLRGDPVDARSNIFSLGAILYEMVTERKAFAGEDADQVRQAIYEATPVAPVQINPKAHPALSEVIMKALSGSPEDRYQSGQDLVNDLERCKESATKTAAQAANKTAAKKPAQGLNTPQEQKPAIAASTPAKKKSAAEQSASVPSSANPRSAEPSPNLSSPVASSAGKSASPAKAAAAAAGWESGGGFAVSQASAAKAAAGKPAPQAENTFQERASAVAETEEAPAKAPALNVDPAMAEAAAGASRGPSFSEISELPPLKEIYTPPPAPPATEAEPEAAPAHSWTSPVQPEKPKIQPREVARKAVKEIKKTPPKLFVYSIAAACGVILLVVAMIAWRIHSENSAEEGASESTPVAAQPQSAAKPAWSAAQPPVATAAPAAVPEHIAAPREQAVVSVTPKYSRKRSKAPAVSAAAVIPGQLTINSTPEGAEVHIDGHSDPSWVTPFNLPGLSPGQHSVTVARAGYAAESRTIDVASGSKSFLVVQLAAITAQVAVSSEPAGAQIFVDGKDSGRVTPAQLSVDKPGSHTFVVRKQGYLEETTSASLQPGQIFRFSPSLKMLGSTDDIKVGGKFKKLFGGGDTAGMGSLSVKTQPKGAQVAVNNRIMDKLSPLDLYLGPGTYVVDITMSGYKPVHRVIEVQKGGKIGIDEALQHE